MHNNPLVYLRKSHMSTETDCNLQTDVRNELGSRANTPCYRVNKWGRIVGNYFRGYPNGNRAVACGWCELYRATSARNSTSSFTPTLETVQHCGP
jgi:hypothetical protein